MIIDAIIILFVLVAELAVLIGTLVVELVVQLVFVVASCFGKKGERASFSERWTARRSQRKAISKVDAEPSRSVPCWGWVFLIGGVVLLTFSVPIFNMVTNRTIEVEAGDGLPLPLAKFVIEREGDSLEVKSSVDGELVIPRRGVKRLRIADRRYKDQTWEVDEIGEQLSVERSLYGKGLDYLMGNK